MIFNPYILLGALGTAVALALGSYFYGVNVGKDKVEVAWQAREAKINAATAVAIQAAETKARTAERKSATDVAGVSTVYQQKLKETEIEQSRIIASVRAGTIRLRDPNARPPACRDALPAVGTGPGGRDGTAGSELSDAASEFLIGEASRADGITEQLAACQAIVRKDRE